MTLINDPTVQKMAAAPPFGETVALQPGDLILVGSSDPISRMIQAGTRHPVSHAALVYDEEHCIEAYSFRLSPTDQDEGVYLTPLNEVLVERKPTHVTVRRPVGLGHAQFLDVCSLALEHSPPFPTTGAILTSMLVYTSALPLGPVHRWLTQMSADGVETVHCSELVARVYALCGVDLLFHFDSMVLVKQFSHVNEVVDPDFISRPPRVAEKDTNPKISKYPLELAKAVYQRHTNRRKFRPDMADLITPGDLLDAGGLNTVYTYDVKGKA